MQISDKQAQSGSGTKRPDATLLGIGLLLIATILFAFQDVLTKQLTTRVSVTQILVLRYFSFTVFALIIAHSRVGLRSVFRSAWPGLQVARCLIMCTEIGIFAYAVRFLGIAEIHAIFSCFPLVITALSVPLLKEQVGWRRWCAVTVGFIGTLIILQPGSGVFNPAAMLALVCVLLYSIYNILTRKVSAKDRFETSLVYFGVVGLAGSFIAVLGRWQTTDPETAWLLAGVCFTSVVAHMLLIKSLELASAVVLQPFNYFILVWAILFGYLVFGEVLELYEVIGALIVVSSGVYVGLREYQASTTRRT